MSDMLREVILLSLSEMDTSLTTALRKGVHHDPKFKRAYGSLFCRIWR